MTTKTMLPVRTVKIDFPQAGEVVTSPSYTLRVDADGAAAVEVSLDGGPLLPCRYASGYWWFDWNDCRPGPHTLRAQARSSDGEVVSDARRVLVRPAEAAVWSDEAEGGRRRRRHRV